jgi:hypothetical protein
MLMWTPANFHPGRSRTTASRPFCDVDYPRVARLNARSCQAASAAGLARTCSITRAVSTGVPPSATPTKAVKTGRCTDHAVDGQSALAAEDLAAEVRTGHGAGGSCCQPFACEYVQPQGTYCVCAHPSSVGVQHKGPGAGAGAGGGSSARATPLPETKPAARAATIASFIFMYTVFLVSVLFASGRDHFDHSGSAIDVDVKLVIRERSTA